MPLLCAGLSVWMPVYPSGEEHGRQVHIVLSPHLQRIGDGVCRSLSDGMPETGGLEESEGSDSRVSAGQQRAGVEAPHGDRSEGLLPRIGWSRSLGENACI